MLSSIKPSIASVSEDNNLLKFTLSGVNVSIANSIRRTILSDIQIPVFKTFPYDENQAVINKNTTRFNNEIIKQRLSCIPIHIKNTQAEGVNISDWILEVKSKNDEHLERYITTKDFKIKENTSGQYLPDGKVRELFPPNPITGDYIDFVRLRPNIGENVEGEELDMTCRITEATAKEDAMFNVVGTCAYGNTPDPIAINDGWRRKEEELKKDGKRGEELKFAQSNWMILDAQRYYKADSFDFTIETVGVLDNTEIFKRACQVLVDRLNELTLLVNEGNLPVSSSMDTTMYRTYVITLNGIDYTLGKILEFMLHENYYKGSRELSFCGFRKMHPHDMYSILRVGMDETDNNNAFTAGNSNTLSTETVENDKRRINTYVTNSCAELIEVYSSLIHQIDRARPSNNVNLDVST
jgi:DNA-directed RNA polymerase subunit L